MISSPLLQAPASSRARLSAPTMIHRLRVTAEPEPGCEASTFENQSTKIIPSLT